MSQASTSIRSLSILLSVAAHAAVLASMPGLFGENGAGTAESSSTLLVSIQRSQPADDLPKDNPGLSTLKQSPVSPVLHPETTAEVIKVQSASTTSVAEQVQKTTPILNTAISNRPATNRKGADIPEKKPMQVATSGSYARISRDYLAALLRLVERHKYYPLHARRSGIEGKATVSFTVRSNGEIRDVVLARSSQRPILDQAAIQTIKRIGNAPPFPDSIKRSQWRFAIPIAYNLK